MDEKKIVNLEEDLTTEHTNEPVSLEEQAEQKMQKTILTTDQQTEKVLADELEVELVDENEMPNEQAQEVPLVLDANITSEEESRRSLGWVRPFARQAIGPGFKSLEDT